MEARQNQNETEALLEVLPPEIIQQILFLALIQGANHTSLKLVTRLFKELIDDLHTRKLIRTLPPIAYAALRQLEGEKLDEVPHNTNNNSVEHSAWQDTFNKNYKALHQAALSYCDAVVKAKDLNFAVQFNGTKDQEHNFMFGRLDSLLIPEISGINITSMSIYKVEGTPKEILRNLSSIFIYALKKNHWSITKYILDLLVFNSEDVQKVISFPEEARDFYTKLLMTEVENLSKKEERYFRKLKLCKTYGVDPLNFVLVKENKLLAYYLIHCFLLYVCNRPLSLSKWTDIKNPLFFVIDSDRFDFANVFINLASKIVTKGYPSETIAQIYLNIALRYLGNKKRVHPRYKKIVDYLLNRGVMPTSSGSLSAVQITGLRYLSEFEPENEKFRADYSVWKRCAHNTLRNKEKKTEDGIMPVYCTDFNANINRPSLHPTHFMFNRGYHNPFFKPQHKGPVPLDNANNNSSIKKEEQKEDVPIDTHQPAAKKQKKEATAKFSSSSTMFGSESASTSVLLFQNQAQEPLLPVPPLVDDEEARQLLQRQRNQATHTRTETENTPAFSTPKKEG